MATPRPEKFVRVSEDEPFPSAPRVRSDADVDLLLALWRHAAERPSTRALLERLSERLQPRLPHVTLTILRVDADRSAAEPLISVPEGEPFRDPLRRSEWERVRRWCQEQSLVLVDERTDATATPFDDVRAGTYLGPLNGVDGRALGVFVLHVPPPTFGRTLDLETFRSVLEPVALVLAHELEIGRDTGGEVERRFGHRSGTVGPDAIIGREDGLRDVMNLVNLVKQSHAPVLLIGETGSGKEVIARAIHDGSDRPDRPFIRVNCGAIPSELIDSELFGHERGSFTGAVASRKGWFERADGGTLFLDEIGELAPAAQVRLLRILQDGTFERVGGQAQLTVDVRIIAATHRDLQAMVADYLFREDLWYRLSVFPIRLPPLRERLADIAPLAEHFARRAAERFGIVTRLPTAEDMHLLRAYAWPGNVRELAAVLDRAALLGGGRSLDVTTALGFQPPVRGLVSALGIKPSVHDAEPTPAPSAAGFLSLDAAMAQHIRAALTLSEGRIEGAQGAAELLRINPHTLRARMRKLGVDWTAFRVV